MKAQPSPTNSTYHFLRLHCSEQVQRQEQWLVWGKESGDEVADTHHASSLSLAPRRPSRRYLDRTSFQNKPRSPRAGTYYSPGRRAGSIQESAASSWWIQLRFKREGGDDWKSGNSLCFFCCGFCVLCVCVSALFPFDSETEAASPTFCCMSGSPIRC